MIKVGLAKSEYIDLIAEFEENYFNAEKYTKQYLIEILSNNHILKNNTNIFVVCDDDELLGYIIFSITDDFTDILKIFIREYDRKKGYAKLLIDTVYNLAKRYNSKKIMIEVRSNNRNAIKLYEKCNFKNISIRRNYYKDPTDDAIIYEREIV